MCTCAVHVDNIRKSRRLSAVEKTAVEAAGEQGGGGGGGGGLAGANQVAPGEWTVFELDTVIPKLPYFRCYDMFARTSYMVHSKRAFK